MNAVDVMHKLKQIQELISRISAEIVRLTNDGLCSGVRYYRNNGQVNGVKLLYANHGIDQVCPTHGKPDPGQRLRIYVGKDQLKRKKVTAKRV